jgi:hypothetical protein
MLTAGGRAPPFGDLTKCATAAVTDAGTGVQRTDFFAGRWRFLDKLPVTALGQRATSQPAVHSLV